MKLKIEKFLEISPFFAIQETFNSLSQYLLPSFKKEGVNLLQGLILVSLLFDQEETIHPGLLVKIFKTSKSSMSQAISELEYKNFIKRVLDGNDARSHKLTLSPKGIKVANQISAVLDQVHLKMERTLGELRLQEIIQGLGTIREITQAIK